MPVLDQQTYEQFRKLQEFAKKRGFSFEEVLQHAELLLTPERRHSIEIGAVTDLIRRLDRQSPNRLMSYTHHRSEGTSAEMFEATLQWLQIYHTHLVAGTLEEL